MTKGLIDWEEYERWIRRAKHTLKSLKVDIEHGDYCWACFKAQQAAEYALRALLRSLGKLAFGRDLRSLGLEAKDICSKLPNDVWKCMLLLDKMYIPTRYPDVFSSGSPFEHYTEEEAEDARTCAEKVVSWVESCAERLREGVKKA